MTETENTGKKIWISVAGGLILSFFLYVTPWLRENVLIPCGKGLWRVIAAFGHHLASSATVPWWLLWMLILLSGTVLLRIAETFLKRKASSSASTEPSDWRDFTGVIYKGVKWAWRYDSGRIAKERFLLARCR
jgi:hypothetical protein